MKLFIVNRDETCTDTSSFDHRLAMQADPSGYGFTQAELKLLTPEEIRIGMTKEFLQARADIRLQHLKKKRLRR